MPIKSWHGNCRYRFELIIFGGFLGLNMIVSMARESSAEAWLVRVVLIYFLYTLSVNGGIISNFA